MDEVKLRSVALLILFDQAFSAFAKSWGFLGPQTHFTCANGFRPVVESQVQRCIVNMLL
jgi:hypothetical protein